MGWAKVMNNSLKLVNKYTGNTLKIAAIVEAELSTPWWTLRVEPNEMQKWIDKQHDTGVTPLILSYDVSGRNEDGASVTWRAMVHNAIESRRLKLEDSKDEAILEIDSSYNHMRARLMRYERVLQTIARQALRGEE